MRDTVPKGILFPLLLIPMFLGGLDTTLFNSVAYDLPVLDDTWRLWFIDGYSVALAASIVLGSRLGARMGPGLTLAGGLAVFAVAGASPALLDTGLAWTVTRFVQGFGYALMVSSVASIVGSLPRTEERTLAYSLWIGAGSLGAGIGPLFGRIVVDSGAYTILFWLPALLATICGVFAWALLRGMNPGLAVSRRIDVTSSALAFVGFGLLIGGLQSHVGVPLRVIAAVVGCALLALFCRRQIRSSDPLIDVRMLSYSRLGVCALAIVFGYASYTGSIYLFSARAETILEILPISLLTLWVSLGGLAFSKLHLRFTPIFLLQASVAMCALGLIVAAFAGLWLGSFLIGIGVGVSSAAGDAYLLGSVGAKDVARAAAVQETSFAVGAALGVAGVGGILATVDSIPLTAVIAAVAVAAVAASFRLSRGNIRA